MAKYVNPTYILQTFTTELLTKATTLYVCSAAPATRAEAITLALASFDLSAGFTGSYNSYMTITSPSYSACTFATLGGLEVTANGQCTHVAVISASYLLALTTCAPLDVLIGEYINVPSWAVTIGAAT